MDINPIKIFISYRRTDSPGHVGRLSDALRNKYGREQIFKDVTNIRGGVYFPEVIKNAIGEASVMIVTIGPRWTGKKLFKKARIFDKRDWIRQEIEAALNNRTHILPLLVNGGEMPNKSELPMSLDFFTDLNAVTVRDHKWEDDIEDVYNEIEQLVKLPPLSLEAKNVVVEKKTIPTSILITLSLIGTLIMGYFIFKPMQSGKGTVDQQYIAGDWRNKIALIIPKNSNWAKSTGFFVSKNGHILTLSGSGNSENDSVFNILTSDRKSYPAYKVSRIELDGLSLILLKSPLKNTPFIKLASRIPLKNLSIEILGVQGDSSQWKRYTARVLNADARRVFYDRPEEGWLGMMGAPIVDVSDEVAFGVHMGTVFDSISNSLNKKIGLGFCFTQTKIDSLLNQKN